MSKMHVSLDVKDLDSAVCFYRRFFGAEPAKLRPGYANFDLQDPPLKLALNASEKNGLSHLGIQVDERERVMTALDRFKADGMEALAELDTNCCHALQDKVWVKDPDGHPWEVFVVKEDTDFASMDLSTCASGDAEACHSERASRKSGHCCS